MRLPIPLICLANGVWPYVFMLLYSPGYSHVRNVFMVSHLLSHRIKLFGTQGDTCGTIIHSCGLFKYKKLWRLMMIIIMPKETDSRGGQKSNRAVRRNQSETGRQYRMKREFKITECIIYLHVHTLSALYGSINTFYMVSE